jgi:hypothetical protein
MSKFICFHINYVLGNYVLMPCVGCVVLRTVVMKNIIFWDITLCSALKVIRRFGKNIVSIFSVEE